MLSVYSCGGVAVLLGGVELVPVPVVSGAGAAVSGGVVGVAGLVAGVFVLGVAEGVLCG